MGANGGRKPRGWSLASGRVRAYRERDIAVVGVACRYPGAPDKDAFWERVRAGWDPVGPFPEARRSDVEPWLDLVDAYGDLKLEFVPGAYLESIDRFDPRAFRLTPREAALMDPAHRLFLECAVAALEDAGYGGRCLEGSRTGVFAGFAPDFRACNYKDILLQLDRQLAPLILQANLPAMLPARISYLLDLKGPSVCVDTACSSSLVAVHLACASIRKGESTAAIAGGVKLNLLPLAADVKVGIESDDGYTRPFDDRATGTGVGEGAGAVFLKPLTRARRDGDHVYAVIRGSAVGQDGRSAWITAPDPAAQADTLARAWNDAGIDPETLDWIEAHGTATSIGDPVELAGITMAMRKYTSRRQFCAITSLKGSLNHLFEGAGIASFIKACLCLDNEEIAPSTRFETPNRAFDFADSPVYVNVVNRAWPRKADPRRCGINAFGMSGTNCHVVLEEAPVLPARTRERIPIAFTASARDAAQLLDLLERYRAFFREHDHIRLEDACFTVSTGRPHLETRAAIVARDMGELLERLDTCVQQRLRVEGAEWAFISQGVAGGGGATGNDEKRGWASLAAICRRHVAGEDVDWAAFYEGRDVRRVPLPASPLQRVRCWYDPPAELLEAWKQRRTMHYQVEWLEEPRPPRGKEIRHALLLAHPGQRRMAQDLREPLERRGIPVHLAGVATLEDARRLVAEPWFAQVSHLVHLQTAGLGPESTWDDLLEGEKWGIRSLYHLVRAMDGAVPQDLELALVVDRAVAVDRGDEPPVPGQTALVAMGRVLEREEEAFNCFAIDIGARTPATVLLEEIEASADTYFRTLRGDRRFVEALAPTDLDAFPPDPVPVRPDGVYLITGGTGGLGIEVARHLAARGATGFALLSRSGMVAQSLWPRVLAADTHPRLVSRVQRLQRLADSGCRLAFPVADVSDPVALEAVAADLRDEFGRINGVVHCAGVPSSGRLAGKRPEAFDEVVRPKTRGGWLVARLGLEANADFTILFSSVASILPAAGQADYAAANGYLDGLARAASLRGRTVLSLNWVAWKEVGMAADTGVALDSIVKALAPDEALQAFQVALDHRLSPVLIGALNYRDPRVHLLEKLPIRLSPAIRAQLERSEGGKKRMGGRKAAASGSRAVRLTGRAGGDYSEIEQAVASIWADALGYEELDVAADFYDLGGDSIQALRILNGIQEHFGVRLRMADVLACRTVQEVAALLASKAAGAREDPPEPRVTISRAPAADAYPLSAQQRRMYAIWRMNPNAIAYNMPVVYQVEGLLDVARFRKAVAGLVARHEALRTWFFEVDGRVMQHIAPTSAVSVEHVLVEGDLAPSLRNLVRPFALDRPPLWRVVLLEDPEGSIFVFFDIHHIVADGASVAVLIEDLAALYAGRRLSRLPVAYRDYAAWQGSEGARMVLEPQERYWKSVMASGFPAAGVPPDPGPGGEDFDAGRRCRFSLEPGEVEHVRALASRAGVSLFTVFLAAYAALLARYAGTPVVTVGVPVVGRTCKELERVVGLFVNTVLVRLEPGFDRPFKRFLGEAGAAVSMALENQDYQLDDLLREWRALAGPGAPSPLTTLFVLQNQVLRPVEIPDLELIPVPVDTWTAKADLALELVERSGRIEGWVEYRRALYQERTISRLVADYQAIVAQVAGAEDVTVDDLELSLDEETAEGPDFRDVGFDL